MQRFIQRIASLAADGLAKVVVEALDDQQREEEGEEVEPARADRDERDGMGHHQQRRDDGERLTRPVDFASRYDTSTNAGSTSKLKRKTFLYE